MNLHIQGSISPNIHISFIVFQSLFLDYYICSYIPGTVFLCYSLNKQTLAKTLCKFAQKYILLFDCKNASRSALYFYRALGLDSHLGKPPVSWFEKYIFLQMYTLADTDVL